MFAMNENLLTKCLELLFVKCQITECIEQYNHLILFDWKSHNIWDRPHDCLFTENKIMLSFVGKHICHVLLDLEVESRHEYLNVDILYLKSCFCFVCYPAAFNRRWRNAWDYGNSGDLSCYWGRKNMENHKENHDNNCHWHFWEDWSPER